MTYNKVEGFAQGAHGNGRVIIKEQAVESGLDAEKLCERLRIDMIFGSLGGCSFTDAYLYVCGGDNGDKSTVSRAMIMAAASVIKDRSKITLVTCRCHANAVERFARANSFQFVRSECGGYATLAQVVREKLAEVPAPLAIEGRQIKLVSELTIRPKKMGWSYPNVREMVQFADTLWVGADSGKIYYKSGSRWHRHPLQTKQSINILYQDGETLLVGDGSCCSGAVYRIYPDMHYEQILPVDGQRDDSPRQGNLLGNVYSFARFQGELLCGVGGCSGQHLYRLNANGKFEFHPLDPEEYVTAMYQPKDMDILYLAFGQGWSTATIAVYDGRQIRRIGSVYGGNPSFYEKDGRVFTAGTNGGDMRPTTFSNAQIVEVTPTEARSIWKAEGGVSNFFEFGGRFYAYGIHQVSGKTEILERRDDGWHKVAALDGVSVILPFGDKLYAGGTADKAMTISRLEIE
jgi:hypothetical protein